LARSTSDTGTTTSSIFQSMRISWWVRSMSALMWSTWCVSPRSTWRSSCRWPPRTPPRRERGWR